MGSRETAARASTGRRWPGVVTAVAVLLFLYLFGSGPLVAAALATPSCSFAPGPPAEWQEVVLAAYRPLMDLAESTGLDDTAVFNGWLRFWACLFGVCWVPCPSWIP